MDSAILLCRISSKKQDDGYSLKSQEKHGKTYCKKLGFNLVKIFSFVETASKSHKRTKFDMALEFAVDLSIKQKKPVHLIVEKSDRLTRNFDNSGEIHSYVDNEYIIVHYFKENRILDRNSTPEEIFADNMNVALSQLYVSKLKRETHKGMVEKASQGWFPSRAPYGYVNKREASKGSGRGLATIIPDPNIEMVLMVQKIYELRAMKNLSYKEILNYIRASNLIPVGKTLSKTGVEEILKNKFYGGTFIWDSVEYRGNHELIIPLEHFRKVHNKDKIFYTRRPSGLLSGWLLCSNPDCQCHILYDPKTKRLKTTGEKVTYHYYHCSDGKGIHKTKGQKQKNISQDKLLDKFERPVSEISISEELAKAVSKALKKAHDKTIEAHKRNMDGYRTVIKQTEKEEDKAYELLSTGVIDQETYQRQVKSIRVKKRQFEDLLEEGQVFITTKFYETSDKILELAKNAKSLWKERSDEEKLEFLKLILSNQSLNTSVESLDEVTMALHT